MATIPPTHNVFIVCIQYVHIVVAIVSIVLVVVLVSGQSSRKSTTAIMR